MSKSTTLRHLMMLKILPKYPSFILVKDLQSELQEEGFSVDLRTVQRDLRSMQDLMGLDCCDSPEGYKWRYARVNTEMLPNMRPSEALLLVIAEEFLTRVLPLESLRMLEPRLQKAKTTLDKDKNLGKWRNKLKVISGELELIPNSTDEDIRSTIYECILKDEKITITYRKRVNHEPLEYLLNPQGLIVRDHNQYLIATKSEALGQQRTFLLEKIISAERTYQPVDDGCQYSFDDAINRNPTGYMLKDELIKVCLRAKWVPARLLSNNKLSSDQTEKQLEGGWIEVYATTHLTYDLIGWICRFAEAIEVVQPKELREQVYRRLVSGIELNKPIE
ncbi:WYL domain-containing protein [Neiella marina]|uniref:WYL domain-containing protein n=1 Tax=Neiella holothuriorum TaxID=2870530 RepID=A0ABS7EBR0_9GAMM|nr:WYL domain-containing protein [Neiella holothuriorum]MBW8189762.1 WYL domain-containing protein [Neiella holothuriorum]